MGDKPKCPDYSKECHQKFGIIHCRDIIHENQVRCPVIDSEVEAE